MGYWLVKAVLAPVLRLLFRPKVTGLENLPTGGGALLAANHTTFMDNFMMPMVNSRRVTYLAKSDYFTGRGIKGRLQKMFFSGVGMIPLDRSGGRASEAALNTGLQVLKEGGLLGIFPEGTRSPDGRLHRGKTGVARLALEAGVPVVPVGLIGLNKIQPGGRGMPKLGRIEIRIGKPLDFSRYAGMEGDRFVLRSITDEIMYELMVRSEQEYVDQYAAQAKADLADARRAGRLAAVGDAPAPSRRAS